jgi:hypothetical protein
MYVVQSLWAVISYGPKSKGVSHPSYLSFGIDVVSEVLHCGLNLI